MRANSGLFLFRPEGEINFEQPYRGKKNAHGLRMDLSEKKHKFPVTQLRSRLGIGGYLKHMVSLDCLWTL